MLSTDIAQLVLQGIVKGVRADRLASAQKTIRPEIFAPGGSRELWQILTTTGKVKRPDGTVNGKFDMGTVLLAGEFWDVLAASEDDLSDESMAALIAEAAVLSEAAAAVEVRDDLIVPKEGLQVADAADAVLAMGPLAQGRDGLCWRWRAGVWVADDLEIRRRCTRLLGNQYRTGHETNVRAYLAAHLPILDCRPTPEHINFTNGMLRWRSETLEAHDPDLRSTVQLNVPWEPEAECPHFDKFVSDVMHDDAEKLFWQLLGYLLLSGNPLHKAFLFVGTGGNGKGTTIRVINKLLGHHNVSSVSLDDLNNNRFSAAELYGKIANIAGDIDASYQEHTAMMKSITGEDEIQAEHKFRDTFRFEPWAVPVFSANEIPPTVDASAGYLRRWQVLKFPNTFRAGQDPDLEKRFDEELPGIAFKAVRGLVDLMKTGLFDYPPSAVEARKEFEETVNPIKRFLSEECVYEEEGVETNRDDIYRAYEAWTTAENIRPLSRPKFYVRVEGAGYIPRRLSRGGTRRMFKGLRLKSIDDKLNEE